MSWDLIRISWPSAAMPFALALLPFVAFVHEWQANPVQSAWVQAQEQTQDYEMSSVPSLAGLEQPANNLVAFHPGSI